jgi:hypothetical protein
MQRAHAGSKASGRDEEVITHLHAPRRNGAGDHGACAGEAEAAVHRHAKQRGLGGASLRLSLSQRGESLHKRGQSLSGVGGNGEDGRLRQRRAGQPAGKLGPCLGQPLRRDGIRLGQRHYAPAHPQQGEDRQVLARLRPDAFRGRHHQQHGGHACGARQHGIHKAGMARHIHEGDGRQAGPAPIGKAKLDGDAARLLLLQAVRVMPRHGLHEAALAVVDVACGADDHARHGQPRAPGGQGPAARTRDNLRHICIKPVAAHQQSAAFIDGTV